MQPFSIRGLDLFDQSETFSLRNLGMWHCFTIDACAALLARAYAPRCSRARDSQNLLAKFALSLSAGPLKRRGSVDDSIKIDGVLIFLYIAARLHRRGSGEVVPGRCYVLVATASRRASSG